MWFEGIFLSIRRVTFAKEEAKAEVETKAETKEAKVKEEDVTMATMTASSPSDDDYYSQLRIIVVIGRRRRHRFTDHSLRRLLVDRRKEK
ncbi:MAG: hypothetical protein WC483_03635 [Candidatus Paceibacterota bacterium]